MIGAFGTTLCFACNAIFANRSAKMLGSTVANFWRLLLATLILGAWAHAAGFEAVRATSSTWTFTAGAGAQWWGGLWAERVLSSGVAEQALNTGVATKADLAEISRAWLDWGHHPDAWLVIPHGEILISVG